MRNLFGLIASTLLLCSLLLAAGCGMGNQVVGSGQLIDDERRLLPFDEIVVDAPVNIIINAGTTQLVNVRAQGQVLPVLTTEVKGDKLTVKLAQKAQMDSGTAIEVTVPTLKALTLTSSGSAAVYGATGDKLNLALESSGSFVGTQLKYDGIKIKVGGSGDIELDGSSDDLQIDSDSSGDVDAFDMIVKDAKITSKGSGDIRVTVQNDIKADIKGSGSIYYRGEPEIQLTDEGSGELVNDM